MASTGERSRGQHSFKLVQDTLKDWDPGRDRYRDPSLPGSHAAHQVMSRPPGYAESSYFIHQRYEDTALVIFQQNLKKKKEANPGWYKQREQVTYPGPLTPAAVAQHPLYALPSPAKGRPYLNTSPSKAGDGGYSSPGTASPASGASPQHSPGSAYGTPKSGPSPVRSVSPGAARGAAANFGESQSVDGDEFVSAESGGSHLDSPEAQPDFPLPVQATAGHSTRSQSTSEHDRNFRRVTDARQDAEERRRAGIEVRDREYHRGRHLGQETSVRGGDPSTAGGDGVSDPGSADRVAGGVQRRHAEEVGRYGSQGIVVRRPVAMTKSDTARTQSSICIVM